MTDDKNEILLDLLCKRAVYGLTEEETIQLEQVEADRPNVESFEMTAAMIGLVDLEAEKMPEHLQAKVMTDAGEYFDENTIATAGETSTALTSGHQATSTGFLPNWLGWAVAAAASIALAINLYSTRNQPSLVQNAPTPTPTQPEKLDPARQRLQLINSPGVLTVPWDKGNVKEITEVSGDVVWSDTTQSGFIRINGLPKNDISKECYQLWIFDETQDKATPIDGGTFDIGVTGEVIIPIDARLNAKNPSKFAITIEKMGGVVVSKLGRVAALAPVKPNRS